MANMIHNASGEPAKWACRKGGPRCRARQQVTQFCNQGTRATEEIYRKASSFSISAPRCLCRKTGRRKMRSIPKRGRTHENFRVHANSSRHSGGACACRLPWEKGQAQRRPGDLLRERRRLDNNPGTQGSPFKTITHALRVATRAARRFGLPPAPTTSPTVKASDHRPAGVLLIGDETNKGGEAPLPASSGWWTGTGATAGYGVALLTGAGSTIAGFTITNDNPALSGALDSS